MLRESSLLSTTEPALDRREPDDPVLAELRARFDDVEVLRWPDHEARRREAAAPDVPRLLVVAPGAEAPRVRCLSEEWIREPIDHAELMARHAALLQRVGCAGHAPLLDADGLLWWGDQWVAVPDAQIPVVDLLVRNVRQLVRREDLLSAYEANGGSANAVALKAMLGRLVKRFAAIGLELRSIRGRGYLLDAPNDCPLHAVPAAER